jgi:excisionase family DNA binding protein
MLTVREAADYLRVNVKTLYADIEAKRIKALRVGRVIRIPRSALLDFAGRTSR